MTSPRLPSAGRTRPVGALPRGPASAGLRGTACTPVTSAATLVGCVAVCSALAAAALVPDTLDRVGVPIAIVGVLVGIPHGAVDHMVPFWVDASRPSPRALARAVAEYLVVATLAATALILAPAPTVVLFLVVSALHFGRGEVTFAAERAGRPIPAWRTDLATTLVHGGVVVVLPLTLWHDRAVPLLDALAPALAHPVPRTALLTGSAVLVVAALGLAAQKVRTGCRGEAGEVLLVLALFAGTPPLVSFGVYFGAWHAVRHTGRLLALPGPDGALPVGGAVRRYLLHAAGPTVVAFAALVVADRVVDASAVPVAVAVLLALTFPHLRTVARWDRSPHAQRVPPVLI